jgi:hypothetical protein
MVILRLKAYSVGLVVLSSEVNIIWKDIWPQKTVLIICLMNARIAKQSLCLKIS